MSNFQTLEKQKYNLGTILLVATALILLLLPFVATFNEFLTSLAEKVYLFRWIENVIVPFESRWVVGLLSFLGIESIATNSSVFLTEPAGVGLNVFISWNCIGWQSFILLIFTFLTMLQGVGSGFQKMNVVLFGIIGTFWVNLIRIAAVILLAKFWGLKSAILFHDYAGNLMVIVWLLVFWLISFKYLLISRAILDKAQKFVYNA
ncbi:MAG TPA: exosortase/archaeosortase family protein [Patescibacteria group bacterium]